MFHRPSTNSYSEKESAYGMVEYFWVAEAYCGPNA